MVEFTDQRIVCWGSVIVVRWVWEAGAGGEGAC